ncbi:LysR family transcriptional regulator [uncultured Litoreibacter sp.]|uniref:LysR family transcriptional regulator n=1 Tax=uncultured Litoreibacter sp. TaxID=1392394 RepID=UPI002629744D|nr:LysR family transcriptional regulator [uncultured Litoreibacter sp.]
MPSFDAIAIFAKVAQSQSFTDAARALDMPLSSVSRKVAELEADLNARLIDRSKRQIRLTKAGTTYLELCRKGLESINYANRVMTDRHSDTTGTVTITVPPNLMEVLFLEAIESFQLRHPNARLRVLVSERMLDFVDDGVDLSFRVARPEIPDLVVKTLLIYRHRLIASPGYLAANTALRTVGDLKDHKTIGFGFHTSRYLNWSLSRQGQTDDIRFEPDLAINDYAAVQAAVLSGQGIGELPEPLCRDAVQAGQLVEVLPEWHFPEITLYAVHAGNASLSKLARLFLDTVFSKFNV